MDWVPVQSFKVTMCRNGGLRGEGWGIWCPNASVSWPGGERATTFMDRQPVTSRKVSFSLCTDWRLTWEWQEIGTHFSAWFFSKSGARGRPGMSKKKQMAFLTLSPVSRRIELGIIEILWAYQEVGVQGRAAERGVRGWPYFIFFILAVMKIPESLKFLHS